VQMEGGNVFEMLSKLESSNALDQHSQKRSVHTLLLQHLVLACVRAGSYPSRMIRYNLQMRLNLFINLFEAPRFRIRVRSESSGEFLSYRVGDCPTSAYDVGCGYDACLQHARR
jgi:hypothetical protein